MSIFSDCNDLIVSSSLGDSVTFKGTGALTEVVEGIFRRTHLRLDPDTQVPIQTDELNLFVVLSDLSREPTEADFFEIDSTTYKVDAMEKDAHGGALIFLSET